MAFSLPQFTRRVSPDQLRAYLEFRGVAPDGQFRCDAPPKQLLIDLLRHVESLPKEPFGSLLSELERVDQMSDELGERCLLDSSAQRDIVIATFSGLPSAHDRSLKVFISDPDLFARAELLRFVEMNRLGRMWDGYFAPQDLWPGVDATAHERLRNALTAHFQAKDGTGRSVVVDVFERGRSRGEDRQSLVQVMVYLEGLPASSLEFEGEEVTRRTSRPALQVAWTYAPETGELEVLASGGREQRAILASMFMEHLLGHQADASRIPLRRFNLDPLLRGGEFPTDPEDGIAKVTVRRLRLRPFGDPAGAIVLERERGSHRSLHELSHDWFGDNNPLKAGFRITQAGLTIEFRPSGGRGRGKIVQIDLSLPSGSNLKERTEADRLLSEKYLAKWGLIEPA